MNSTAFAHFLLRAWLETPWRVSWHSCLCWLVNGMTSPAVLMPGRQHFATKWNKRLYIAPNPNFCHIPIEINHTTVILMSALARELHWLAWIGFLMAMNRSTEMAQRCMMDAVEKRTSRNNQAGHRTNGRGHITSERKKNKHSSKWQPSVCRGLVWVLGFFLTFLNFHLKCYNLTPATLSFR